MGVATVNASEQTEVVSSLIHWMQPKNTLIENNRIATSILKHSKEYDLDWMIVTSIIAQESMFIKDPQNCLHRKKQCIDYGIGQINFDTWGNELNLDRKKLLVNVDYNIETIVKILSLLQKNYGQEKRFYTRYHSFTHKHRNIYFRYINHKYVKIKAYTRGYLDSYPIKLVKN